MIDVISEVLKPKITSLGFIERYGGLTQLVCKTICIQEKPQIFKDIYFPVTCEADDNCFKQGEYSPIVPGNCTSIAYLEADDLVPVKCDGPKGNDFHYTFNLRLVFWGNLAKLGYEKDESIEAIIMCFIRELNGRCDLPAPYMGYFDLGLPRVTKDMKRIFGIYSYFDKIKKALLYPNAYFALDWKVKLKVNMGCATPEELNCEPRESILCKPV